MAAKPGSTELSAADWARALAERFRYGRVVPFLGAGVNLADRSPGETFTVGSNLPSGKELARHLAKPAYKFPPGYGRSDLMRVSQWVDVKFGDEPIYDEFRQIFTPSIPPTTVHTVLAEVPALMRKKGAPRPNLLIVTTNYDDAMERAFDDAGEKYDVLWYMARENEHFRRFLHRPPGGEPEPVLNPQKHPVSPEIRNVVLKVHGAIDRDPQFDGCVVSEDDYVDFMASTNLVEVVPRPLITEMLRSHFLFLGYSLGDWNLRAFLHGLWDGQWGRARNVAIDREHTPLDKLFWDKRGVDAVVSELSPFMTKLRQRLRAL